MTGQRSMNMPSFIPPELMIPTIALCNRRLLLRPTLHEWLDLLGNHENRLFPPPELCRSLIFLCQWGSQTAIGDVTEAAGWKILGCSPDELTQDIRLVCMGGSLCQHLSSGHGAADTIVRLPENVRESVFFLPHPHRTLTISQCGKGPFARVQKMWVPTDQSIPASIAARIARRDGSQPQVQAITLDTNFAAVNNTKCDFYHSPRTSLMSC